MLKHAREITYHLIEERKLSSKSLVIELVSNDGYLLQYFVKKGIPVLGIDPAQNVAEVARERGVPTLCEFFGEELARELALKGRRADVVIANNVLAHVADLNGFVEGIRILLKEEGMAVIEVPYVKEMIDKSEFDTIYHEHLCYFSLTALEYLFRAHGMLIVDVERIPIHGGSLRIFVGHKHTGPLSDRLYALLEEEKRWVKDFKFYLGFRDKVEDIRSALRGLLEGLKSEGKRIAAYGAAAKGTVLLNYCGIGKEILDFVVDRNPHKQ